MSTLQFDFTTIEPSEPTALPNDLNNAGQLVGSGGRDAFVYSAGTVTLFQAVSGETTEATAINDSGEITGEFGGTTGFVDSNGTITAFNAPGSYLTYPTAINASGQIAGWFTTAPSYFQQGFIYASGTFETFDVPGAADTTIVALNNNGDVAGNFSTALNGPTLGFVNIGGVYETIDPAGATFVDVTGMNNAGEVVGYYGEGRFDHGFIYSNGTLTTVDAPGQIFTQPMGINDSGEIFGDDGTGAFVDINGTFTEVMAPGATQVFLTSINSSGQLAGLFANQIDNPGDFIATPTSAACFRAGTRIATESGWANVEDLRVGDRVRLARRPGRTAPVQWLGHRSVDCRQHPRPHDVWPIRVAAHAFAAGRPARDLFLSPDHAVLTGGALIPVRYLVNGGSVAPVPMDRVTYWHVELARHDVLLAEGLPCETYLDTGNRGAFANGGAVAQAHPDFARRIWADGACAPLALEGARVARAKARLLARLPRLGHEITRDPDLAFTADGKPIAGVWHGALCRLRLPAGVSRLALHSRTGCPAELDPHSEDTRRLGVALLHFALEGEAMPLHDLRLVSGWLPAEDGLRWTDGAADIDITGARDMVMRFGRWLRYLAPAEADQRLSVA